MTPFWPLLALAAATSNTQSLTAVRDSYPSLSPDGTQLIFTSNRNGRHAIWIARGDGSDPRVLFDDPAAGTDPSTPVWSPDSRRIAFAMTPAGSADAEESDIYLIDADGRGLRRLTETPGDDSHPHWSRTGRIYFNSPRATPDPNLPWSRQWIDIYSMADDGSDVRRHTDCRSVCTYPVPSPDERFVVHRRVVNGDGRNWDQSATSRNSEIFVTPLDGSPPVNLSNSPAFDGWPTWSPDGRWIIFASNRDGAPSTGQIYAVRPDGTAMRALTRGSLSRAQPSFSADGRQILAYETIETADFEIGHIVRFDGPGE